MKRYESDAVEVTYEIRRCIHAAECVKGLPAVFDPEKRPWVDAAAADPDALAEVVRRCPTGALHVTRKDGGPEETPPANAVDVAADGPLYLRGRVVVQNNDGAQVVRDTRVALCRCGASKTKPICDGSHAEAGFAAPGCLAGPIEDSAPDSEELTISAVPNGPLLVSGPYRLASADGTEGRTGGALCRCGASSRKPFCDGTHAKIGFGAE